MVKFLRNIFYILVFIAIFINSAQEVNAIYDPLSVPNNIYGIGIINHSDLDDVNLLVNSSNGKWGYVTVVITEKERSKEIWQSFFDECRRKNIIPIVRVASSFENGNWKIPDLNEIDNWVIFFDTLNWVIENRYVIIGNEPNHAKEWGGKIDPENYAKYLKEFSTKLKSSNKDYYVLNAGFDQDAPTGKVTMDQKKYLERMLKAEPDIFNYIDGWNSHSYPNPAFSGSKLRIGRGTIKGYEWELEYLQSLHIVKDLPIFITETGWKKTKNNSDLIADNMEYAYKEIWSKNSKVVAVTPFILNYQQEPFKEFSWKEKDSFSTIFDRVKNLQKIKGEPKQKISGVIIFKFISPLVFRNTEYKGITLVRNTGQAIWLQSDSQVVDLKEGSVIKVSNTKFTPIEPFKTGLVVFTLTSLNKAESNIVKIGLFVKGEKIGDIFNGKIISF
jgi:hypothetical protein